MTDLDQQSPDFLSDPSGHEQNVRLIRSGTWTVFAMFGFAAIMIAMLFLYWELYTKPFRPLQYAIAERYPDSSPKVIGGQHKSHKDSNPVILRLVVNVPEEEFDPTQKIELSEERALDLARLAFEHVEISKYDQLDVVLLQKVPEGARKRWNVSHSIDEWTALIDSASSD